MFRKLRYGHVLVSFSENNIMHVHNKSQGSKYPDTRYLTKSMIMIHKRFGHPTVLRSPICVKDTTCVRLWRRPHMLQQDRKAATTQTRQYRSLGHLYLSELRETVCSFGIVCFFLQVCR